jgi:DhnA family fructose-bisphosphate aldolase class Ia
MSFMRLPETATPGIQGMKRRLGRIFQRGSGRLVLAPVDDSLLAGPFDGLESLSRTVKNYISPGVTPDAVIGFRAASGLFAEHACALPFIMNLSASSTLGIHVEKSLCATVEDAVQCGADAVAVHVNFTSRFESSQVRMLGTVVSRASRFGMPVLGVLYPRREVDGRDDNYNALREQDPVLWARMVSHAVRIGAELGCSLIKSQATATGDHFAQIAEAASGIPVVIAGGTPLEPRPFIQLISSHLRNGAAGVSFGRNFFNRKHPNVWIDAAVRLVHDRADPQEIEVWIQEKLSM